MAAASLLVASASSLVGVAPATGFETDQYLTWGHELKDSTKRVNRHLNREIKSALRDINRRQPPLTDCLEVPELVYLKLFPGLLSPRFRELLKADSRVARFPADLGYREYLESSIYRKPAFPFLLPMSQTISVADVRFGLDKIGHFFGFGRRYYVRYLRAVRRGLDEEAAMRKVIIWGLRLEMILVGGLSDGIFSYADLEANFQGLMLALDFCHGDDPLLTHSGDGWRLQREVDLRDYITPRFDEAYNNNHYRPTRWKKIRPILKREYCARRSLRQVAQMLRGYRDRDRPSFSHAVVAEYFANRGLNLQHEQSLAAVCGDTEAMADSEQPAARRLLDR